ncbi:MAG: hypothetical protein EBY39_10620 [Flavobacteriia bacterium]|nr:hypothetical protein [Flavobacteriia bacterium]
MIGPSIELIRYEPKHIPQPPAGLGSYLLIVRATGKLIPSEIFIYHEHPGGKNNPYSGDVFEAIATPRQIEELPINRPYAAPDSNDYIPFYRRNQLELYFLSLAELDDFWQQLQSEVSLLVDNYKRFEDLESTRIPKPDKSLFGWLPAHMHPNPPKNAKYFYNIDKHYALKSVWEKGLPTPYELHSLEIDGYNYPQGDSSFYIINNEGIFWLDFDPESYSDHRNKPRPYRNPWPDDYFVGFGSSDPNLIRLRLFV